jgi:formate dehydrogenase subunit gamma
MINSRAVSTFLVFAILCALTVGLAPFDAARAQQPQSAPQTNSATNAAPIDPDASVVPQQKLLQQFPRIEGKITIPDQRESVLMQPAGRTWRYFHEVLLHWIGLIVIVGMIAVLAIFYLLVGPLRISAGRSGARVKRFNAFERFSHWLTAISFVALGLTGLNITFGKLVLMPVIGHDAFGTLSEMLKYVHNFASFPFVAGLVFITAIFIKDNIPRKIDIIWLKEGGGFIPSKHPQAGRFNAGEKLVFWFAIGGGIAVAGSGYLLLFPFYVTNILGMQLAQVVHSLIAVLFVAVILGHIYIGTLGMEGAFEAMGTGSVDLNWAKEHHRLWLEDEIAKGHAPTPPPGALSAPAE